MSRRRLEPMEPMKAQAKSVLSRAGIIWLNFSFWIVFTFLTLYLALVAIPYHILFKLISRNQRKSDRLIRRTIAKYGGAVIRSGWPLVRVQFVDCAPDDKPPFVFVANHRSSSDAFLTAFLTMESVQVLNIWPSRVPLISYLSRTAGYLRVREMPFEEFIEAGTRLLNDGVSIIAFPEGTRSGSKKMGPFHGSAFRLAQRTGVKICPLAISGNENIPRRGSLVLNPGRIVMTKLPALTFEQHKEMTAYALKNRVRETIHRHLEAQDRQTHQLEAQPA
jgi:1-acyl-sn-glycerol-3-phosphate acyltransferase